MAKTGLPDEGLAAIDEVLETAWMWWMPEALRIKGEILLSSNNADATLAEDHFRRSLDLAQKALTWELRTAISLGHLYRAQGCIQDLPSLLNSIYGQFTEAFGTADLRSAKLLLDEYAETG